MKKVIIQKQIFDLFPTFHRGVILVKEIDNSIIHEPILEMLNDRIKNWTPADLEHNDFVVAWDEVHRKFGSNPNKYPPSIKSLLKRINKGGSIPFINSVVALFNYISLKYLIPCGGDDVDRIDGNLVLGFSKGNEKFIALGSNEMESPDANEVIYYDDKSLNVMCRRWNWRNGDFSKITEKSKHLVINLDGVGSISLSHIEDATNELANLLSKYCNAELSTSILSADNRSVDM